MKRKLDSNDDIIYFHQCIGEGTYGKVYSVSFGENKCLEAMKILKYDGNFHNDMPAVIRELLIGGTCTKRTKIVRFQKNGSYGIVSRIGDCTLSDVLQKKISIDEARFLSKKLLFQLNSVHSQGFMHRDIKPENILLNFDNDELNMSIIDYGLSSPAEKNDDTNVTSLWWRPPEVILGFTHTIKIDIWSFGVILANMCCKTNITASSHDKNALKDIWTVIGFPSEDEWNLKRFYCSAPLYKLKGFDIEKNEDNQLYIDLLQKILKANPHHRPSCTNILNDEFYTSKLDFNEHSWCQNTKLLYKRNYTVQQTPLQTFSRHQAFVVCSDESLSLVDIQNSIFSFFVTDFFLQPIKKIAINCDWDTKCINLCILMMIMLNDTISKPSTLACSVSYVICCLYANNEPTVHELKVYAKCEDSHIIIESGIHYVLESLKYKLITDEQYMSLINNTKWEKIRHQYDSLK